MKAVSLFSGIGGLDYGFLQAGIDTVLQVENDPWCQRVLFPDGWTDHLGIADSHRYRMLGNAVDTVVAQWLGHRLALVDSW